MSKNKTNTKRNSIAVYLADIDLNKNDTEQDKKNYEIINEIEQLIKDTKQENQKVINKNLFFRALFFETLGIENEDLTQLYNVVKEKLNDSDFISKFREYEKRENSKKTKLRQVLNDIDLTMLEISKATQKGDLKAVEVLMSQLKELNQKATSINENNTQNDFKKITSRL